MESDELQLLREIPAWIEEGLAAYLVTVIQTWGSSPRPPGSLLALREDGRMLGSVSGGCVEYDLQERLFSGECAAGLPRVIEYGREPDEARRMRLPCGSVLSLVVEQLADPSNWRLLHDTVRERQSLVRELCMTTGSVQLRPSRSEPHFQFDGRIVCRVFGPKRRLIIIGAENIARHLASMAVNLDYHVLVCEPREEYADAWDVEGTELVRAMPDDVIVRHANDSATAVVALSHDPRLDDLALMEALPSALFYVGALGSVANNNQRRERLARLDVPAEAIARLRGPVGLSIGARTPAEIAVSILAEIIAVYSGKHENRGY